MRSLGTVSKILSLFLLASLILVAQPEISNASEIQAPLTGYTGDAFADLVVGVPGEDIPDPPSSIEDAGMIHVIYGFPMGLNPQGNQTFDQDTDLVVDQAEEDDQMGSALASGDFNGDGNYDIAVGIPFEDIFVGGTTRVSAGAVHVFYGSEGGGLSVSGNQFLSQATLNVEGSAELSDHFGYALAVGNFNGDAYDDLAIGVPLEDFESVPATNAGSVIVIYGSASGLSPIAVRPDQMWYQGNGIADSVEDHDWFGYALAAGDFDSDNYDDLAIGAPGEDSEAAGKDDIGVVHVLYGTAGGLSATGNQQWEQYDWGGSAESEAGDQFGRSLAVGKFKWRTYDALAIGVPYEDIEGSTTVSEAGAVNILFGSNDGLEDDNVVFLYQDGGYIDETAEYHDHFGASLAAVDFSGFGTDNLVVGVPDENLGDPVVSNAGAVHVLTTSGEHFVGVSLRYFHQDRSGIPGDLGIDHKFGSSLAPGDFNGDGKEDLAIGVPFDSCNVSKDGSVIVIYDDVWGALADYAPQYWCQGGSLLDQGEVDDHFGVAIAALPSTGAAPYRVYLPICMRDD
jgi:hypothetical protein